MTPDMLKNLLDACFTAKRITEIMPPLPAGMTPRHIHIIDAVHQLAQTRDKVHPRDVSDLLNLTPPCVTRLIGDLDRMKCLRKQYERDDKRFVSLELTRLGEKYHNDYVANFHAGLSAVLEGVTDSRCRETIQTVNTLHDALVAYISEKKNHARK